MSKTRNPLMNLVDGSILIKKKVVKQFPFIIFLTFLAFIYIANRLSAENTAIKAAKLEREIKTLKAESMSISSELIFLSNKQEVANLIKKNHLSIKFTTEPPKKVVLREKEN
jgi:hypothetical protein